MTSNHSTPGYDPFNVKPLQLRTRRLLTPGGGSISITAATFLFVTVSTSFYLLVPLEFLRPDIIGWNRTARARAVLQKETKK